jgi:hypothetical protein
MSIDGPVCFEVDQQRSVAALLAPQSNIIAPLDFNPSGDRTSSTSS